MYKVIGLLLLSFALYNPVIFGEDLSKNPQPEITYHATALYDCKGPVKTVKLKTKDPLLGGYKVSFSPDGMKESSVLTYNSAGYPIGFNANALGLSETVKIKYNEDWQPETIIVTNSIPGNIKNWLIEILYDQDQQVGRQICNLDSKEYLGRYTYKLLETDLHGNWVKRAVSFQDKNGKVKNYEESRNITYYQ